MTFWIDLSTNRLQNVESKIVRLYPIHNVLYLTIGYLLTDPKTQNGDTHDHSGFSLFFVGR